MGHDQGPIWKFCFPWCVQNRNSHTRYMLELQKETVTCSGTLKAHWHQWSVKFGWIVLCVLFYVYCANSEFRCNVKSRVKATTPFLNSVNPTSEDISVIRCSCSVTYPDNDQTSDAALFSVPVHMSTIHLHVVQWFVTVYLSLSIQSLYAYDCSLRFVT